MGVIRLAKAVIMQRCQSKIGKACAEFVYQLMLVLKAAHYFTVTKRIGVISYNTIMSFSTSALESRDRVALQQGFYHAITLSYRMQHITTHTRWAFIEYFLKEIGSDRLLQIWSGLSPREKLMLTHSAPVVTHAARWTLENLSQHTPGTQSVCTTLDMRQLDSIIESSCVPRVIEQWRQRDPAARAEVEKDIIGL